jgi:hypothetical protein
MKNIRDIGVQIPQIYLPNTDVDLGKWAVIACDQFTSEPEYWDKVKQIVGDAPSALNLTFPEVDLDQPGANERIAAIQLNMKKYLSEDVIQPHDGLIYVERTVAGQTRRGIMLCLDLEHYDFHKGSDSLIRATEGTIEDRLPPRMKIRQGAALELPHILVLIDDPKRTVIEPVGADKDKLAKLYDFDLMLDSGHLTGYAVNETHENQVIEALRELAKPKNFSSKYGVDADQPVLLFAMGDGNHSLATAKAIWEKMKLEVGPDHPSRYALVEIENVHDAGLEFEAIHRVVFGLKKDILTELKKAFGDNYVYTPLASRAEMMQRVDNADSAKQAIGLVGGGQSFGLIEITDPSFNLAVGTIQSFLDVFLAEGGAEKIDYVHGADVVERLGSQPGNAGFYLAGMPKDELFKTVILDGALPRKTFSMGEARDKRFYMEARKIT